MNRTKLMILCILLPLLLIVHPKHVSAADLDEIQNYTITVDPFEDGSLRLTYHFDWKVLNDSSEGPLSWVRIGIPNSYVNDITALSDTIKKIKYDSYNSGSYVRIDFDRSYYKDEIVSFDFSVRQSFVYTVESSSSQCKFHFTAGWFDDIRVNSISIYWKDDAVMTPPSDILENGYYVVTDQLKKGKKLTIDVTYPQDTFQYKTKPAHSGNSDSNEVMNFLIFLFTIVVVFLFIIRLKRNTYRRHHGFGWNPYRRSHYHVINNTTHRRPPTHHSCVHSSCACACACAGGGRAGCSKKDFFHVNVNKVLNNN